MSSEPMMPDVSGWDSCYCGNCGAAIPGSVRFAVWDNRLSAPKPGYKYEVMNCPYCGDPNIPLTAKVNNE